jgi:hypothetical protein
MGYGTRDGGLGGEIRTYWPDDDKNTLHIAAGAWSPMSNLQELLEKAQEKWPGISLDQIQISAHHIHTDCIGYDHTDFIVLRKIS